MSRFTSIGSVKDLNTGRDMVTSRVMGVAASQKVLKRYGKEAERACNNAGRRAAEYLLKETIKVTPEDTGALRDSGRVHQQKTGPVVNYMVAFHTDYAIIVHEDLTLTHANGTYAKFLERTAKRVAPQMQRMVQEDMTKAGIKIIGTGRRYSTKGMSR